MRTRLVIGNERDAGRHLGRVTLDGEGRDVSGQGSGRERDGFGHRTLSCGIGRSDRQRVGRVGAHADRWDLMVGGRCGVHGLGAVGAGPLIASSIVAGADVVNGATR